MTRKTYFSCCFFDFFYDFGYNWIEDFYYVFITFMKKAFRILILWGIVALFGIMPNNYSRVEAAKNSVPAYYYANYKFIDDWIEIWDLFRTIKSRYELGLSVDNSMFAELYTHFANSFPQLTQYYKTTYEKCLLLAEDLSKWYSDYSMEALMWNACYKRLSSAASSINSSYTVHTSCKINPNGWMAPLTVTFDARGSSDPSIETIPSENYYWYYRDTKWNDVPIWEWQVITHTFEDAGTYWVHLVVRSSNVDEGILDWEQDIQVVVSPKAANIVVYANTRRMTKNSPIKIWTSEWEKWVIFDGSATMPREKREIKSHTWTIRNPWWSVLYTETNNWSPSYMKPIVLRDNGKYAVTLTTRDNENNTVSETFEIYISDPVSVIRQTPSEWNTSTTMTFDGSASYSIKSRLSTYAWEIFNEDWEKVEMSQWKKINRIFTKPWNYLVRLIVTTSDALQNEDIKEIFIDSTTPTPQFVVTPTSKRKYPSEFTLDASNSTDIDVLRWEDSLEYSRKFSTENYKIISTEDDNRRIVVQFDDVGLHTVELKVTDKYGKHAEISKTIQVQSTLRPEIEAIPGAITRWKEMQFKATVNKPDAISTYMWNFWDWKTTDSQYATDIIHIYWQRWVYPVTLTVYDKAWNFNTVTERVFIWEIEFPIAAYRIKDSRWFYVQASEECKIEGTDVPQLAYPVDRYASITINPSISVNTQGNSKWLIYVFEPESLIGDNKATITSTLTHKFSQVGCHYVDLTVQDSNIWKQDKTRIWFSVRNALPKVNNVTLSFPQYSDNSAPIGFSYSTTTSSTNKTVFDCGSWTSNNITVKVTAVEPSDSDWTISRLRFYYYNIDDPDRILDTKETWITNPYVYFSLPRRWGEYKFWVMIYDNDGWMIDSEEYLWSNPSIYLPSCSDSETPTVTLKLSSQNIEIWDTVTYSVVSRIVANNQDFDTDRTFYYDFTWDGKRDLVTKKDKVEYTFMEAYEGWVKPRAAVEYRWKLWTSDWPNPAVIYVRNGIKPILLYNSIGNTVIFRDLSIWVFQQRQLCFEVNECKLWNTKYQKTHIVTVTKELEQASVWPSTVITENDSFLQKYSDYWTHNVSIYLKNKYWVEVKTWFVVKTLNNSENWRIAPGINMITIPETTFNNSNPEIFLSKAMNNTVLMYINNDTWEECYVDMDTDKDSDWDGQKDNDMDVLCNKMAKIVYQPNYEVIWRIYFKNNWQLTFKNFYVQFEGYVLELDDEKLAIYKDITTLMNWIEDSSIENVNLKDSLNTLRNHLSDITVVTPTVIAINEQIAGWWIRLSQKQKDLLDSILDRLSNADTIISVWMSEYETSKVEILSLVPKKSNIRSSVEEWFANFEEETLPDKKAEILTNIFNMIKKDGWFDSSDMSQSMEPSFCSIVEYYGLSLYTDICTSNNNSDSKYNNLAWDTWSAGGWMKTRLKIVLFVLVGGLLAMWWIILFFSIKAKLSSTDDEDEW